MRRAALLSCTVACLSLAAPVHGQGKDPKAPKPPDRVVFVARPQTQSRWSALAQRASSAVRRLWEREEPHAVAGNAAAASGDGAAALQQYDLAAPQVPENSAAAGALSLDRASALLKQAPDVAPQALAEANRALAHGAPALRPLANYDIGYALEQLGKPEEAIEAYRRTLAFDPDDADAKVNLELLLRGEQTKKPQPSPAGEQGAQKPQAKGEKDEKKQGKPPPGAGDQQKQPSAPQAGGAPPDKPPKPQGAEKAPPAKPEPGQAGGAQDPGQKKDEQAQSGSSTADLGRAEAQRLLDALKQGEKNLEVWRFGKKAKEGRRSDVEKDW